MTPELRKHTPNVACAACGARFYASPGHIKVGWGRFCSFRCRSAGRETPSANATCKGCGVLFHVKPSHLLNGKGRSFCSDACQQRAHGMKTATCNKCGQYYEYYPSRKTPEYCSRKCAAEASRKPMIELACVNCGVLFKRLPSVLFKRTKSPGSFCSNRCKHAFMSASSITVAGVPRGTRATRGGLRPDIGIYVRSSWEANYARYLNWLIGIKQIDSWEYEPDTFEFTTIRRGSRFYTPDFKVIGNDGLVEYHEVKGYMDGRSATKLKRMAKYYPDIKIIVIGKEMYADLRKRVAQMIDGWE